MKRKIVSVILAGSMLIGMASCTKTQPTESETSEETTSEETTETTEDEHPLMGFNMIENGDFSSSDHAWHTYFEGGDGLMAVNSNGELQFDCKIVGNKEHSNQLYYDGFSIYQGCKYELQFDCSSTVERDFAVRIQINGSDYHAYVEEIVHATPEMQHFDVVF